MSVESGWKCLISFVLVVLCLLWGYGLIVNSFLNRQYISVIQHQSVYQELKKGALVFVSPSMKVSKGKLFRYVLNNHHYFGRVVAMPGDEITANTHCIFINDVSYQCDNNAYFYLDDSRFVVPENTVFNFPDYFPARKRITIQTLIGLTVNLNNINGVMNTALDLEHIHAKEYFLGSVSIGIILALMVSIVIYRKYIYSPVWMVYFMLSVVSIFIFAANYAQLKWALIPIFYHWLVSWMMDVFSISWHLL